METPVQFQAAGLLSVLCIALFIYRTIKERNALPGPPRWPIIGNAHYMPRKTHWKTFSAWKKKYGDLIHMDIFGRKLVVINSFKAANDLLDKRSSIYSDRPHLVMAMDLVGYKRSFVFQSYGDSWREQRKLLGNGFSAPAVPNYYPVQEEEAKILVQNLLAKPESFYDEIKRRTGTISLRVVYGYNVKDTANDVFLNAIQEALENFSIATIPGRFLVDSFPFLKHVPKWMPGSGFLRTAIEMKQVRLLAGYGPFGWAKNQHGSGSSVPSLCGDVLREGGLSDWMEDQLVWSASAYVSGGFDAVTSQIMNFYLAMLRYPEIQRKAREEIKTVFGDRIPVCADMKSLPYCRSIVVEIIRWGATIPMGFAHTLRQDDIYNGVLYKKGTRFLANIWHMLNDPDVYPNPLEFNPDRYGGNEAEMKKVIDICFGFGRRRCPGYNFLFGTQYAIALTTLATCEILPALDINGKPLIPDVAYTTGSIVVPEEFGLRLRPLSPAMVEQLSN